MSQAPGQTRSPHSGGPCYFDRIARQQSLTMSSQTFWDWRALPPSSVSGSHPFLTLGLESRRFPAKISYYLLELWIFCPQPWPWFYGYSARKVSLPRLAVSIGLFAYQLPISPCLPGSDNLHRHSSRRGLDGRGFPKYLMPRGHTPSLALQWLVTAPDSPSTSIPWG